MSPGWSLWPPGSWSGRVSVVAGCNFRSQPVHWTVPGGAEGGANRREYGGMLMNPARRKEALRGNNWSLDPLLDLFVLEENRLK